MFHTNNFNTYKALPYEKTVHEYRAPTDESLKILTKMEEKLMDKIVARFQLRNVINADAYVIKEPFESSQTIHYSMVINGETIKGEYIIEGNLIALQKDFEVKMFELMAKQIAIEIMKPYLENKKRERIYV